MTHDDHLLIRPADVNDATIQLGELTERIRAVMDAEALNLTVVPSARDEVSQRVASTLNEVHASFTNTADRGHARLRDVATDLRAHTAGIVSDDDGVSA